MLAILVEIPGIGIGFYVPCRGVPRIFERGFPLVLNPRHRGLGTQPPAAEEL